MPSIPLKMWALDGQWCVTPIYGLLFSRPRFSEMWPCLWLKWSMWMLSLLLMPMILDGRCMCPYVTLATRSRLLTLLRLMNVLQLARPPIMFPTIVFLRRCLSTRLCLVSNLSLIIVCWSIMMPPCPWLTPTTPNLSLPFLRQVGLCIGCMLISELGRNVWILPTLIAKLFPIPLSTWLAMASPVLRVRLSLL